MALSLGVSPGSQIRVGGRMVVVTAIASPRNVSVQIENEEFLITDQERTEIMDDVFVSCGRSNSRDDEQYSRLAFEAPREVRIERVRA